jgi:uncharacterized repeat protein (TIGR01451 family)
VSASYAPGTLTNTAVATTFTDDSLNPASTTNTTPGGQTYWIVSAQASINVVARADLSIAKSITAPTGAQVAAGDGVSYSVTVTNAGPSDAQAVGVSDPLPAGTSLPGAVSWSDSSGGALTSACPSTSTNCPIGTLPAGASVTETFTLLVSASYAPGTLTNTATATTTTDDSANPAASDAGGTWTVQAQASIPVIAEADLTSAKAITSPTTSYVIAGNQITYVITVGNSGPSDSPDSTTSDALPAALDATTATATITKQPSGNTGTCMVTLAPATVNCSLGTLPVGSDLVEVTVTATVLASDPEANTSISNTACVSTPTDNTSGVANADVCSPPVTITEKHVAQLTDTKVVTSPTSGSVVAGNQITYLITVGNQGPSDSENTVVSDSLPASLDAMTATASVTKQPSPNPGSCTVDPTTRMVTCSLGLLPVGSDLAEITVTATVLASDTGSSITNTACATTTTPDNVNGNPNAMVCAPATVAETQQSDLTESKTASVPSVIAGDQITYTITVGNNGPSYAQAGTVTDTLPSSLDPTTAVATVTKEPTGDSGSCTVGKVSGIVSCALGVVPVGPDLIEVQVTATVLASDLGTSITNRACTTSTTDDTAGNADDQACSQITTPETQQAQMTISKAVTDPSQTPTATPVVAGQPITYSVTIGNTGPSFAQAVTVSDPLPSEIDPATAVVSIAKAPAGNSGTCSVDASGNVSCALGALPVGSDLVELTITGTVKASDLNTGFTNQACTATTTPDNQTGAPNATVCASAAVDEVQRQLVTSVKAASASTVAAGNQVTYTITVANNGPSNAQDAQVSDPLPASLDPSTAVVTVTKQPVGNSGTCTIDASTPTVNCTLGTLPVGSDLAEITVTATVLSSDLGSSITNTACTTTTTPDAGTGTTGLRYCGTSTITETQSADVSIVKTAGTSPIVAGTDETYTLAVTNNGPSDAQAVTAADSLPSGTTFVSASTGCSNSSGTVTCGAGTLSAHAPNNTASFTVTVLVSSSASGNVSNTATVSSPTPDPNLPNNTSTVTTPVTQEADLALVKTASPAEVVAGGNETYTLTVTNNGPSDAEQVLATDDLPVGLQFESSPSGCTDSGQTVTCTAASLSAASGQNTLTFTIVTKVLSADAGSETNSATVTSATPDPVTSNNGSAVAIPLSTSADLSLTKRAEKATVPVGSDETYDLVVTNHGPSNASKVVVTDALPTGLTFVSASKGCTDKAQKITCKLATLGATAPKNTATFKVVALVGPTAAATTINTATVKSSTADPDMANNTATATAKVRFPILRLVKTAEAKTVADGADVSYLLTVRNIGKGLATDVKVCDALPTGTTLVQATGAHLINGQACWTLKRVAAGQRVKLRIRLKMAASTLSGKVVNHATVRAAGTKTQRSKAAVEVTPGAGPKPDGVTG